jgi:hypothetical protein
VTQKSAENGSQRTSVVKVRVGTTDGMEVAVGAGTVAVALTFVSTTITGVSETPVIVVQETNIKEKRILNINFMRRNRRLSCEIASAAFRAK